MFLSMFLVRNEYNAIVLMVRYSVRDHSKPRVWEAVIADSDTSV